MSPLIRRPIHTQEEMRLYIKLERSSFASLVVNAKSKRIYSNTKNEFTPRACMNRMQPWANKYAEKMLKKN